MDGAGAMRYAVVSVRHEVDAHTVAYELRIGEQTVAWVSS